MAALSILWHACPPSIAPLPLLRVRQEDKQEELRVAVVLGALGGTEGWQEHRTWSESVSSSPRKASAVNGGRIHPLTQEL